MEGQGNNREQGIIMCVYACIKMLYCIIMYTKLKYFKRMEHLANKQRNLWYGEIWV